MRNAYTFLGKPEEKGPCRRPGCRWEDNVGMNLRELGWKGVDWIHLPQDRSQLQAIVNTDMNLQIPLKEENFLSSCVTASLSRRTLLHGVSQPTL
jgi:hypothetical protein